MSDNPSDTINPTKVGVYIYHQKKIDVEAATDKFGFDTYKDIFSYIRKNLKKRDIFLIYTTKLIMGEEIMHPIAGGDSDDLGNNSLELQ